MHPEEPSLRKSVLELLSRRRSAHLGRLYYIERGPLTSLEPWVSQGTPTNFFNRETELLQKILPRLRDIATSEGVLVDLGPGAPSSVARRAVSIAQSLAAVKYVPVDFSDAFLGTAAEVFRRELPKVIVEPIRADFFNAKFNLTGPATFIYMGGSTISNFPVFDTTAFPEVPYAGYFNKLCSLLRPGGHLLVGWHAAADEGYALAPYGCGSTILFRDAASRADAA